MKANQQQIFDISRFGGNKSEARLSKTGSAERIAQAGMLEIDDICLRKQLRRLRVTLINETSRITYVTQ